MFDSSALFQIHNSRVGDITDMDPHDQIHEGVPQKYLDVDLATGGLCSSKFELRDSVAGSG